MTRRGWVRTRVGEDGGGEPCGPRRGRWGSGSLGCGSMGAPGRTLLPPSSSEPESELRSSSTALIAASERNGSHSINEAITSLISPATTSTSSHRGIAFDATTEHQNDSQRKRKQRLRNRS